MFKVEIETDNAAFEQDNLGPEIAKNLRDLAAKVYLLNRAELTYMSRDNATFRIRDSNGNPIGRAKISGIEDSEDE
jgi:hypothetical protein